ncbi:hypothetical protein [Paludisphaera soli]|uniref:hypothetical protein n=1 Tax=Paludisphaera soli TaxID=2712865 RepID=UPI0013EB5EA3|nr:hypothetical protein [Paludisphaera soli]
MKSNNGLILILVGATLILAPVLIHSITRSHDKERIERFYDHMPNSAVLPESLRPSDFDAQDWACLAVGAMLTSVGVARTRPTPATKAAPWPADV